MSLAVVYSRAQDGIAAPLVSCEVHLSGGLPGTSIVGLPETAVKEARDRVRAAILNAQLDYPQRRVTVNLAPADLPKDGGRFDLPIALGILAANGSIPRAAFDDCEFIGELALSGELRAVRGVLPAVLHARREGRRMIVPRGNGAEAALVSDADVRVAGSLLEVCAHLCGRAALAPAQAEAECTAAATSNDLADVRGQQQARRALEIAAAGAHNLLLVGPPGTGKTMLASRLPGILPPLEEHEALELAAVRSVAGHDNDVSRWKMRAFRAPHHTASAVALVGGGVTSKNCCDILEMSATLFSDIRARWSQREFDPPCKTRLRFAASIESFNHSRLRTTVQSGSRGGIAGYARPVRRCRSRTR